MEMSKKAKRLKKLAIILATSISAILIILLVPPTIFLLKLDYEFRWDRQVKDFYDYEYEFLTVAHFCREYVEDKGDTNEVNYFNCDRGSLSNKSGNKVPLTSEVRTCLITVYDAFPNAEATLDFIYVDGNFVYFTTINGYHFIYSADGSKPTDTSEVYDFYIKKENRNWYHMVVK